MTSAPHVFDKMNQDAHVWLHDVEHRLATDDPRYAYHALRGVLFAVRDRIPVQEVFDLSAQLPTVIRGVFFEGYRPEAHPPAFGRDEFLQRIKDETASVGHLEAEDAAHAVADVLMQHITSGQFMHVLNLLPDDVKPLLSAA